MKEIHVLLKFCGYKLNGMSGEDDWLVQAAAREAGMLPPAPDSFEDSDRFEGDSECSWVSSESITLAKNWRGWSQSSPGDTIPSGISTCIYPYQCSYSHSGRYSSASNTVTQRSVSTEKGTFTASLSDSVDFTSLSSFPAFHIYPSFS
ncbi:hypothetical protein TELCIR_22576 [Teladorsagia circumcincta]|uniref:Uncharacterized protein n=1 Tax=Teladorsagia circumcincta TaxID=45464 RepID=A0A2G9TF88_TELCI|nr:hypothetical protein TELCIR_22576 [Teladorsagia circumcincta]